MTEETKEVVAEIAHPQEETTQPVEQEVKVPVETDADRNWKEANQVLKLQKQKIDELESRLHQMAQPKVEEEKDEFAALDQDEYMSVGKARQMAERIADKKAKEAAREMVKEVMQKHSLEQDESRMRSKHDDYDYVMENFAIPLIKKDPALAYKIQQSKNPAEVAYKLAKISDEYEGANVKQQTSPKAEKILKNTSRPVSSQGAGSPLKTQADEFASMSQAQIWEQSQKYARKA